MTLRVLCIGSPFGGDRIAWTVGEHLRDAGLEETIDIRLLDRPGMQLIQEMQDCPRVLLLDAAQNLAPWELRRIGTPDELCPNDQAGTHGLGVAEALQLAAQLGKLPKRYALFAIGMADDRGDEAGLASLLERLRREIAALANSPGD